MRALAGHDPDWVLAIDGRHSDRLASCPITAAPAFWSTSALGLAKRILRKYGYLPDEEKVPQKVLRMYFPQNVQLRERGV